MCIYIYNIIIGPAARIEREWIKLVIGNMKSGRASRPSGIVGASVEAGNLILHQDVVPSDLNCI